MPDAGADRVGGGFITLYALAYLGTSLVFIAPLLVSLALKVNSLVGIDRAPSGLALVTGTGSLLAIFANPFFGRMSDRTSSRMGMRRPWMLGGLAGGSLGIVVVALAPNILVVLVGWCLAQLFFNALLAALVAVLPDQVPTAQRGMVSGVLAICLPLASVGGTFLVQLFTGNQVAMFLVPSAIGALLILPFAATLKDRRLAEADRPTWSVREFLSAFYVNPRKSPDFALGLRQPLHAPAGLRLPHDVPGLLPAGEARQRRGRGAAADLPRHGRPVRRPRRRLPHQWPALGPERPAQGLRRSSPRSCTAWRCSSSPSPATSTDSSSAWPSADSGSACTWPSTSRSWPTCCRDPANAAKDLGVFNIAGALPFSIAPAIAPAILAVGSGSYGVLYAVAGVCAIVGAAAILPVKRAR